MTKPWGRFFSTLRITSAEISIVRGFPLEEPSSSSSDVDKEALQALPFSTMIFLNTAERAQAFAVRVNTIFRCKGLHIIDGGEHILGAGGGIEAAHNLPNSVQVQGCRAKLSIGVKSTHAVLRRRASLKMSCSASSHRDCASVRSIKAHITRELSRVKRQNSLLLT